MSMATGRRLASVVNITYRSLQRFSYRRVILPAEIVPWLIEPYGCKDACSGSITSNHDLANSTGYTPTADIRVDDFEMVGAKVPHFCFRDLTSQQALPIHPTPYPHNRLNLGAIARARATSPLLNAIVMRSVFCGSWETLGVYFRLAR